MKSLRVCFISFNAYPLFDAKTKGEFGGAELQLYYLGTELARDERFNISFITGDFGQPDNQIIELVKLYKLNLPTGAVPLTRTLQEYVRLWHLLKKIDADVYIQRAAGLNTGLIALYCHVYGKKFIYMVAHDNDVLRDQKPSWMPRGIIGVVIWNGFKYGLRNSTLVIVQHDRQKENLKRFYGKECILRPSAHRLPANNERSDRNCILWVARCEDWKQPEIFLELARAFPSWKFCMVCSRAHSGAYFSQIQNSATALPNLTFIDYVPINEIDDYFRRAWVFVNTSKNEGFPNTFIQAAKSGTPILSLNVDPDMMLEQYCIGVCTKGDYQELVRQLNTFLTNQEGWRRMSDNAYEFTQKRHDIKQIVEDDKKVIFSLLKNNL